jgi:hypothetical protein
VETLLETENIKDEFSQDNDELFIRKHIGDFTLFMSGIFREYLLRGGYLEFYFYEGKKSYERVYNLFNDIHPENAEVYTILSQQFEYYSGALDYLKKVYFYYPKIDNEIQSYIKRLWMDPLSFRNQEE